MSKFVPGSTGNMYRDRDDRERSLYQMVRDEPEWACSRIRACERAEARIAELDKVAEAAKEWADAAGQMPNKLESALRAAGYLGVRDE